jgi:hypothetical protein
MECSGSSFCLAVVEAVSLVSLTVVGSQVETNDDLHLLGEQLKRVLLSKRVSNRANGLTVELCPEVMKDVRP